MNGKYCPGRVGDGDGGGGVEKSAYCYSHRCMICQCEKVMLCSNAVVLVVQPWYHGTLGTISLLVVRTTPLWIFNRQTARCGQFGLTAQEQLIPLSFMLSMRGMWCAMRVCAMRVCAMRVCVMRVCYEGVLWGVL